MKTHKHLYASICTFANIFSAAKKAQSEKRMHQNVAIFNVDLEKEVIAIQEELLIKSYIPGAYSTFNIYEPKPRMISAAPYIFQ